MTSRLRAFPVRCPKAPPFLLFAALTFWGWQTGLLSVGLALGIIIEIPRFTKARWDLSEDDFRRLWNFSALLTAGLGLYFFTTNSEGGGLAGLQHDNAMQASRYVGTATTQLMRWLPISFSPFMLAQLFSEGETVPLRAISWFVRRRHHAGDPDQPTMNLSYIYFILVLFAAGNRNNDATHTYFWGVAVLAAWALWPLRSKRLSPFLWTTSMAAAILLGFGVERGLGVLIRFMEGYDAQWFAQFTRHNTDPTESQTSLGQIGKLKLSSRIIIRLQTKSHQIPPDTLREATYNHYYSPTRTWTGNTLHNQLLDIPSDQFHPTAWTLLATQSKNDIINIACYLNGHNESGLAEGLLPLPLGATHLDQLPAIIVKTNKLGAVQADGPGLVVFDAHYVPGLSRDTPPELVTNRVDLEVPPDEAPALQQVIAEINLDPAADDRQKMIAVTRFFATKFTYSTYLSEDKLPTTNETAVARFLLHSRSGHCEYFATATVLLLRQLGIPARYAVGYAVHETAGKAYVVRDRDAHAWCLAWNTATHTWQDLDTTPGSWVAAEQARTPWWQFFSDAWSQVHFQISKLRWGQTNLRQYILYSVGPILVLLLLQIIFQRRRKRASVQALTAVPAPAFPGLDSEFYALEKELAARTVPRQPGEPLSAWIERILRDPAYVELREPLRVMLPLHYAHRFDPRGLAGEERARLAELGSGCMARLRGMNQ